MPLPCCHIAISTRPGVGCLRLRLGDHSGVLRLLRDAVLDDAEAGDGPAPGSNATTLLGVRGAHDEGGATARDEERHFLW